ncbi:hypothetical protein SAMN04488030_1112 [Aliiroseovarius halocynthiae]|uniref:Translation initiation factor 2 n=1 Tax=Aliiroseovarius halocynthiae TaxID=985055 RepID=A0A545SVN9_9RHOB|nr:hypothetical protein [Aliiroseovarius halocynthiae]TQV69027.1 hypothetical protein FIL88_05510 [Aliiroseovarius halocynthiae]SMR71778.1 hypothetical protein SAMN04488030_1112 [Aliiroseovarius halocynthiae]
MKPSFALDLNHDGIGLVHRGKGGWQLVGKVALDDPDLGTAMSTLRDTATALGSGALSSKLIVPGTQILFTSMTAAGPDNITREARIREGLEGLTPYPVEDLIFDWQPDVNDTATVHVAVVAQVTLDEALGFAQEHGMNPVGFVARPKGAFTGEVYLGSVKGSGAELDREKHPVPKLLDTDPAPEVIEESIDPVIAVAEPKTSTSEPAPTDIPELAPFPPTPDTPAHRIASHAKSRSGNSPKKSNRSNSAAKSEDAATPVGFSSSRTTETAADSTWEDRDAPKSAPHTTETEPEPRLSFGLPLSENSESELSPPTQVHVPVTAPVAFEDDLKPAKKAKAAGKKNEAQPVTPAPVVTAVAPPPAADMIGQAADVSNSPAREAESLTIFGARQPQQVGGKPRFLALYLVLGLVLLMAILAIWSMLFLSDTTANNPQSADPFESAITTGQTGTDESTVFGTNSDLIDPALVEGEEVSKLEAPEPLSEEAAQARYAATGIWQRAPEPLADAKIDRIDDLYVASIDPRTFGHDAIALTPLRLDQFGGPMPNTTPPPPPGTVFDLDERGFVQATPGGTLTPEGAIVIAGRPRLVPSPAPRPEQVNTGTEVLEEIAAETTETFEVATKIRPRARPEGLVEGNERRVLGGRTRTELAALRPRARPDAIIAAAQEKAQAQADAIAAALSGANAAAAGIAPTALAVERSTTPKARPKNFSRIVARARPNRDNASDGSVAVAAAPSAGPSIPTRASVAKQATIKNAINLRKVSLIGIYGSASSRRALVRMPSGRYVKVGVGSRLDGGKVVSISTTKLIYQKGRKTVTLNILPFG